MTKVELTERLHALSTLSTPKKKGNLREVEFQTVLHELEVYQIELEMQNRELRESRQALEESYDRYVNLYDFAPIGYLTLNEQGMIKEINLTMASMLGVERRWLLGRAISSWILGSELPLFRSYLHTLKMNQTHNGKHNLALHLVRRDKSEIPVEFSSTHASDAVTGETLFRTAITDLTDRRDAEMERDRFFNLSSDLLCIASADGYFKRLNPAWEKALGHSISTLLSRSFLDFVHPDDRAATLSEIIKLQNGAKTINFLNRYLTKDQNYIWLNWNAVPGADSHFYCVARDTTLDIQAKQMLRESVENLEEERKLREAFVFALSHDLRTPLTAAKISAQLLIRTAHEPVVLSKLSLRIIENMDRADRMIRDLLDANQIRAGQPIVLHLKESNFTEIVQSCIDGLATVHGDRFVVTGEFGIHGMCDPEAIGRVIENLATNALKYGRRSAPVKVHFEQKGDELHLSIHNEGDPISLEDQMNIFKQFKRTDSAKLSGKKGWGIGLTLVKGIVEAHGGNISVKSDAEHGTTFLMRLPRNTKSD